MAGDVAEKVDVEFRAGVGSIDEAVALIRGLEPGERIIITGTYNDEGVDERLNRRVEELRSRGLNIGEGCMYETDISALGNFKQLVIYRGEVVVYDPKKTKTEELRKHRKFALLYNNHIDNANLIADLHNLLPEYERGSPIKINGQSCIPFTRRAA